jgi:hypothetical protein
MDYGWKDRTVMNTTHIIRNIVSQVEQSFYSTLAAGQSYRFENDVIIAVAMKFNSTPANDLTESLNDFKVTIPVT